MTRSNGSTINDVVQRMRHDLRETFPGVRFKVDPVTDDKGTTICIEWIGGDHRPDDVEVDAVTHPVIEQANAGEKV
jgi:hypothetical protein